MSSSGSDSGSKRAAGDFAVIGFSHAYDAAGVVAFGPDDVDEASFKISDCHHARLAIVFAVIDNGLVRAFEDEEGQCHIEVALVQGVGAFGWVLGDLHLMLLHKFVKRVAG